MRFYFAKFISSIIYKSNIIQNSIFSLKKVDFGFNFKELVKIKILFCKININNA